MTDSQCNWLPATFSRLQRRRSKDKQFAEGKLNFLRAGEQRACGRAKDFLGEEWLRVPTGIRRMPDKTDLSESITFALREIAPAAGGVIR